MHIDTTHLFLMDGLPEGITARWTLELKGKTRPRDKDTKFKFGLTVLGRAKLFVDGELVIDNWTKQERSTCEFDFPSPAFYHVYESTIP